jgi:hypothetical protein
VCARVTARCAGPWFRGTPLTLSPSLPPPLPSLPPSLPPSPSLPLSGGPAEAEVDDLDLRRAVRVGRALQQEVLRLDVPAAAAAAAAAGGSVGVDPPAEYGECR